MIFHRRPALEHNKSQLLLLKSPSSIRHSCKYNKNSIFCRIYAFKVIDAQAGEANENNSEEFEKKMELIAKGFKEPADKSKHRKFETEITLRRPTLRQIELSSPASIKIDKNAYVPPPTTKTPSSFPSSSSSSSSNVTFRSRGNEMNKEARHRTAILAGPASYNPRAERIVALIYNSNQEKRSIWNVLDKESSKLSRQDVFVLLTQLQRRHYWKTALNVFGWLKKRPWYFPSSRLYTSLIGYLAREGQPEMASNLFQEMLLEKQKPNHYTFTALINGYGRAKMFDDAIAVFEHMKTSDDPDSRPNTVACNTLLGALCKGRLYDNAIEIFFDMRDGKNGLSINCKPNIVTYNILIDSLCREGNADAAYDVTKDICYGKIDPCVRPNVVTYNILIDAFWKADMAAKAQDSYDFMCQQGIRPNNITYTALIDAYGKAGMHEKAESAFSEMKAQGMLPDVLTYTSLITAYGKSGLLQKAEAVVCEMKNSNIEPNEITYLSLVDCYGKNGNYAKAEALVQEMTNLGYRPNVFAFSSLIDAYGKSCMYHDVVRVFESMKSVGCKPNLVTYAAILGACSRCETWNDALLLLYCLQRSGSEWELAICRLVMASPDEQNLFLNEERLMEGIKNHPSSLQRSFLNSLIDCLWCFGLRGRAMRVMSIGKENRIYRTDVGKFTKELWVLDLHDYSVGAAVTYLYSWLTDLHQAWQWTKDAPGEVRIVTGWGKHSKQQGDSPLKISILQLLQTLDSPFMELTGNCGRLTAKGVDVKEWLMSRVDKNELVLGDTSHPRPSGEAPYVSL